MDGADQILTRANGRKLRKAINLRKVVVAKEGDEPEEEGRIYTTLLLRLIAFLSLRQLAPTKS